MNKIEELENKLKEEKSKMQANLKENYKWVVGKYVKFDESSIMRIDNLRYIPINTIEDYYNSIFDTNLLYFYDFFDLSNEQDLVDFYNILYSMDATLGNNNYVYDYYQKNPLFLFDILKKLYYMKEDFNYGISLYSQLCERINIFNLKYYLNKKY